VLLQEEVRLGSGVSNVLDRIEDDDLLLSRVFG
jgi:hypothetical protein